MNHPHFTSDSHRLHIKSLLPLVNRLLIPAGGGLLLVSLLGDAHQLAILGPGFLIISLILVAYKVIASKIVSDPLRESSNPHTQLLVLPCNYYLRVAHCHTY